MKQKYKKISTEVGYLNGRDCIYLDKISFDDDWPSSITLKGEFNLNLCSESIDAIQALFELSFIDIKAFKILEFDLWDYSSETCFDEVIKSFWMEEIGSDVRKIFHHYIIQTYDHVLEVICKEYHLEVTKN